MRYNLQDIPFGRHGTDRTLEEIGRLIDESQRRPMIRLVALNILDQQDVDPRNTGQAMLALFNWTKRNVRYVHDPTDVETIQSPETTIKIKAGDCDDHATLMAAFAANLGIPARLITIGQTPDAMQHIFAEVLLRQQWTAVDTTIQRPFGTKPMLPATRIYSLKGKLMTGLGTANQVLPITVDDLQQRMYLAAYNQLRLNWQRGLINRDDVASYLRVIAEGNHPGRNTIAEQPMKSAITDFLAQIDRTGAQSAKASGSMNGMEGMDGFLSSVWNAVKSVAGGVVKAVGGVVGAVVKGVTGGGGSTVTVQVPSSPAAATTNVQPGFITPGAAGAALDTVNSLLSNPLVLAGGAVLLTILLMERR